MFINCVSTCSMLDPWATCTDVSEELQFAVKFQRETDWWTKSWIIHELRNTKAEFSVVDLIWTWSRWFCEKKKNDDGGKKKKRNAHRRHWRCCVQHIQPTRSLFIGREMERKRGREQKDSNKEDNYRYKRC